ncbi:MAG: T9SS type A sorting domain-containing protein [Bacteroidales bacterium]|jgi:hypothetical protein|nr:T9SS type A sorting domain-containing protein [Bacteroidales bacterium]
MMTPPSGAKTTTAAETFRIDVVNTANGLTKDAYISYNPAASNGLDNADRGKLLGYNIGMCEPYFMVDDSNMVGVNAFSAIPYECPMNIKSYAGTDIAINFSDIPADLQVTLIDGENEYEVSNGYSYLTTITEGKNINRFKIRIGANENNLQQSAKESSISLWVSNATLNVNGQDLKNVEIYNTLGYMVFSQKLSGNSFKTHLDIANGTYTAKATAKNGSKTIKFVITK